MWLMSIFKSNVWLTVHCNSVWIRNQLDVTVVLSFISPLQVAQHVSVIHVPIFRSWRLRSVIATCWLQEGCQNQLAGSVSTEEFVATLHQHVAITLRSHQLLKMGTWLPETCWATCNGETENNTRVTSS